MVTLVALFEAVEQTLRRDAEEAVEPAVKAWAQRHFADLLEQAGLSDITERIRAARQRDLDGEEAEEIRYKAEDALDEARHALFHENRAHGDEMVEDLRDILSRTLSGVARAYIEKKLGKIDPYVHATDQGSIATGIKKHLYWISHIIVHLKGDAGASGDEYLDRVGGYFTRSPELDGDFSDSRHAATLNKRTDFYQGILIKLANADLESMVSYLLSDEGEIKLHGGVQREWSGSTPAMQCLKHTLDTFVHEVVHLEQDSRGRLKNAGMKLGSGITHLPTGERYDKKDFSKGLPRGSDRKNAGKEVRSFRTGKRGGPSHLQEPVVGDKEKASYYGSSHEIEAHAATAASTMISAVLEKMRRDDDGDTAERKQAILNQYIDEEIANLRNGFTHAESASLQAYTAYAKDLIGSVERKIKRKADAQGNEDPSRRRYPLPKVDELHRKVWRLFMTRVVRHLLAYRRDIVWGEDEYGADPQPRAARVGGITHPAKRPTLPGG